MAKIRRDHAGWIQQAEVSKQTNARDVMISTRFGREGLMVLEIKFKNSVRYAPVPSALVPFALSDAIALVWSFTFFLNIRSASVKTMHAENSFSFDKNDPAYLSGFAHKRSNALGINDDDAVTMVWKHQHEDMVRWWSDSNSLLLTGPTINLHAVSKPLMRLLYHWAVLDFIKKNQSTPLTEEAMQIYESYLACQYVLPRTKTMILQEFRVRTYR
ncbi:hypothetical protein C8R44DRAFT_862076, partial [Mycena epipterygia]